MADKKYIGARTRSKEGPRHVTGRGLYTDDFRLPGMLQAMILRSPHAHAKINSIDPTEALKNPNVMAVITPDDVKRLTKPFKPGRYAAGLKRPIDEYAGAVEKVRYVGEPIGAVAARDRGSAEDALELIQVDYEPLRSVVDVREAIKPSSATFFSMNLAPTSPGKARCNTATSMRRSNLPTVSSRKISRSTATARRRWNPSSLSRPTTLPANG